MAGLLRAGPGIYFLLPWQWFVKTNHMDMPTVYRCGAMPRRPKPDPYAAAIGRRIRELREEAGLTLEKLAFESEVASKGHLSSLEKGLVRPTVHTLKTLADRLDVLVADIVNDPS